MTENKVSQFCYNLATVLDAAIIERNKELIEGAMSNAQQYRDLQAKVLEFADKLSARHKAMGEGADNVLDKYTNFFGLLVKAGVVQESSLAEQ